MFMEGLGLESEERANKAALLLAHERYSAQFASFVKGQASRLSYVEPQIAALLDECAAETGADPVYVADRFANFLRESVPSAIPADSTGIKNDTPSDMDEFVKTDVLDRGEVPGLGLEEALNNGVEKQDLGSDSGDHQETVSCVRCGGEIQSKIASFSQLCVGCTVEIRAKAREGARSDYDHWNEDADRMWWEEEGKHPDEPEYDDQERDMGAEDAAWEELHDWMTQLPPDDLHEIANGTYAGSYPYAEHLPPDGVADLAKNVLAELPGSDYHEQAGDSAEYAERGLRGGSTKEADGAWSDVGMGGTSTGNPGNNLSDPGNQGLMQPSQPTMPFVCTICGRQGTQQEITQHVQQDHGDVLQRMQQQQQTAPQTQAPGYPMAAAVKEADPAEGQKDPAEVHPLPESPGDQFDTIVSDLAERAAARHFSKPTDADFHALAQQLGVDEQQIRENLQAYATFGNYVGINGELADDATPPEGFEAVSLSNGGNDAHQALVPTDLVVGKVAEDMNLDDNLAYNMIRDRYGADLPETYHANVQGQQQFYLPTELAGNQQAQPANFDPTVGPAFQQTPPGAPVPQAPQAPADPAAQFAQPQQ